MTAAFLEQEREELQQRQQKEEALAAAFLEQERKERMEQQQRQAAQDLVSNNMRVVYSLPDGNCFYRSASYMLCGSQERHMEIRAACIQHMVSECCECG